MTKVKQKDLTVEMPPTGWIVISAVIDGYIETRKYGGYSKREACRLFREEFNTKKGGRNGMADR